MEKLDFKLRERFQVKPLGADGYRPPLKYIDFCVNGSSLADLFAVDQNDLIGMLTPEGLQRTPLADEEAFNHFKRNQCLIDELTFRIPCALEYRRVHIYGCPECGDLNCGSVTMQIIETANTVIWHRFDDGREAYANYMSPDKSYVGSAFIDFWRASGRDYRVLDAFGKSPIAQDYEFLHEYKNKSSQSEPNVDIQAGQNKQMKFSEIGPFEFEKNTYLAAFAELHKKISEI